MDGEMYVLVEVVLWDSCIHGFDGFEAARLLRVSIIRIDGQDNT